MKVFNNSILDGSYLLYRLTLPVFDPRKLLNGVIKYPLFVVQLGKYLHLREAEPLGLLNLYPIIDENKKYTDFDTHYVYQDMWALKRIYLSKTKEHFDIGSNIEFATSLSVHTKVNFIDIRPPKIQIKNFTSIAGDILDLPLKSGSVNSLSCLHVAEHIGLGRYGDRLDTKGTEKACRELSRILSKNGKLYFSLPVGKPRLCFNAHRVHRPKQIIKYFNNLKLIEFSGITDQGEYLENIDPEALEQSNYACGLFLFTKI